MHQIRRPYEERETATTKWIVIFVLLSLLTHLIVLTILLLGARFIPPTKIALPKQESTIKLTMIEPPKPVQPPPPPKKDMFFPTKNDPNAKPDPNTPIESDNNSEAKSENKVARVQDSPMPDVTGQNKHTVDLTTTPVSLTQAKPQVEATPPTPKPEQAKPEPQKQPPPEKPVENTKPTPKPPDKPQPPKPPTPPAPKPPTVDPVTGLPVLPPIDAPTLAPPTPVNPNQQQQRKASAGAPPPSFQANKSDIQGSASTLGANSVAANASPLGKYKAQFYMAVGSRWYAKIAQSQSLLGVGSVRIQYTIYADGTITTKTLDAGGASEQMLFAISLNSIRETSPFQPFSDALKAQVGNSFTDEFSFSLY